VAGNAEGAGWVAASHLAASRALLLDQFDDGVVSAAPARQRPSADTVGYSRT